MNQLQDFEVETQNTYTPIKIRIRRTPKQKQIAKNSVNAFKRQNLKMKHNNEIKQLKREQQQLQQAIQLSSKSIKKLQQLHKIVQQQKISTQEHNLILKSDLKDREQRIANLEQRNQQIIQRIVELQGLLANQSDQLALSTENAIVKESQMAWIKSQIQQIKQQSFAFSKQNEHLKAELLAKSASVLSLQNQKSSLNLQMMSLNANILRIQQQKSQLSIYITSIKQDAALKFIELEGNIQRLMDQRDELIGHQQKLYIDQKKMKQKISSMQDNIQQQQLFSINLREQKERHIRQISESYQSKIQSLNKDNSLKMQELIKIMEEMTHLKKLFDQQERELLQSKNNLKISLDELSSKANLIRSADLQKKKLEQQIGSLQKDIEKIKKERDEAQNNLKVTQVLQNNMAQKIEAISGKVYRLERDRDILARESKQKTQYITFLSSQRDQLSQNLGVANFNIAQAGIELTTQLNNFRRLAQSRDQLQQDHLLKVNSLEQQILKLEDQSKYEKVLHQQEKQMMQRRVEGLQQSIITLQQEQSLIREYFDNQLKIKGEYIEKLKEAIHLQSQSRNESDIKLRQIEDKLTFASQSLIIRDSELRQVQMQKNRLQEDLLDLTAKQKQLQNIIKVNNERIRTQDSLLFEMQLVINKERNEMKLIVLRVQQIEEELLTQNQQIKLLNQSKQQLLKLLNQSKNKQQHVAATYQQLTFEKLQIQRRLKQRQDMLIQLRNRLQVEVFKANKHQQQKSKLKQQLQILYNEEKLASMKLNAFKESEDQLRKQLTRLSTSDQNAKKDYERIVSLKKQIQDTIKVKDQELKIASEKIKQHAIANTDLMKAFDGLKSQQTVLKSQLDIAQQKVRDLLNKASISEQAMKKLIEKHELQLRQSNNKMIDYRDKFFAERKDYNRQVKLANAQRAASITLKSRIEEKQKQIDSIRRVIDLNQAQLKLIMAQNSSLKDQIKINKESAERNNLQTIQLRNLYQTAQLRSQQLMNRVHQLVQLDKFHQEQYQTSLQSKQERILEYLRNIEKLKQDHFSQLNSIHSALNRQKDQLLVVIQNLKQKGINDDTQLVRLRDQILQFPFVLQRQLQKVITQYQQKIRQLQQKALQDIWIARQGSKLVERALNSALVRQNQGKNGIFLYGSAYLTINQKDDKLWIGTKMLKGTTQFYTKNSIWTTKEQITNIMSAFNSLCADDTYDKRVIMISGTLGMIKDKYKGKQYYSLRMFNYYKGSPQPTRNGFNLKLFQMKELIDSLYKHI